jgi:hypothetical protein
MHAVSEERTCASWAADWARTLHAEGGIWETLGRAVGWPTGNYDTWVWVSWDEAAALYGHAVSSAGQAPATDQPALRDRIAAAIWERQNPGRRWADCEYRWRADAEADADAVLAVLPAPTDQAAAPAAECSAQNRNYESGPRLCIRAAQHHGDHIDEHGFHWSDTVAVYPLADGTFRTGVNKAELRRMADEAAVPGRTGDGTQPPWLSDSARIGRALIWSWSDVGKGAFGEGYRAAQKEARALLGGQRDADDDAPAVGGAQQPKEA